MKVLWKIETPFRWLYHWPLLVLNRITGKDNYVIARLSCYLGALLLTANSIFLMRDALMMIILTVAPTVFWVAWMCRELEGKMMRGSKLQSIPMEPGLWVLYSFMRLSFQLLPAFIVVSIITSIPSYGFVAMGLVTIFLLIPLTMVAASPYFATDHMWSREALGKEAGQSGKPELDHP